MSSRTGCSLYKGGGGTEIQASLFLPSCAPWPDYIHTEEGVAFSNLHISAMRASSDPGWRAQRITSGEGNQPILPLLPPSLTRCSSSD